jgi:hypothetical protein
MFPRCMLPTDNTSKTYLLPYYIEEYKELSAISSLAVMLVFFPISICFVGRFQMYEGGSPAKVQQSQPRSRCGRLSLSFIL